MNRIMIPVDQVESTTGSDEFLFAAGPWTGKIEITRSRNIPTSREGTPFAGYSSKDGEVLSIQLGDNSHVEGEQQDAVGNRKMFHDFAVEVGATSLWEIDPSERNSPNWQLQRSVRHVTQLAIALGQAEQVEDDNGTFWSVDETFIDNLRSGEFDGRTIGYTVAHRPNKGKNKEQRPIFANIDGFYEAD